MSDFQSVQLCGNAQVGSVTLSGVVSHFFKYETGKYNLQSWTEWLKQKLEDIFNRTIWYSVLMSLVLLLSIPSWTWDGRAWYLQL